MDDIPTTFTHNKPFQEGEPTWDIVKLFPNQGQWAEGEYFDLKTNHFVEFSQGFIEVLPMPSERHQDIVLLLYNLLRQFIQPQNLGKVIVAPMKIKLWKGKFREPDVLFMLRKNYHKRGNNFWQGADLVMEVVSPDDPKRDTEVKRVEYAKAGISEYWIVNPINETITIFTLPEGTDIYEIHGEFSKGNIASSILLKGFQIEVVKVFTEVE